MDNTKYNHEGYADPTAYQAIQNASPKPKTNENNARDEAAEVLIKCLKNLIWLSGFRLIERIKIEDPKSGKKYL